MTADKPTRKLIKLWKARARKGEAKAQCALGFFYANGDGVSQDYKEALKWFRRAADQGYAAAQFSLGLCYVQGEGVSQDYKEAVKWFRRAADQGDAAAHYILGLFYLNGMGVEEDSKKGISLMQSAVAKEPKLQEEFEKVLAVLDSEPEDKPNKEAEERDTVSNVVPLHPVTKRSVIPGPVSEDMVAQVMRSMSI